MKRDVLPKSVSLGASRKNKRRACAINSSINCLKTTIFIYKKNNKNNNKKTSKDNNKHEK